MRAGMCLATSPALLPARAWPQVGTTCCSPRELGLSPLAGVMLCLVGLADAKSKWPGPCVPRGGKLETAVLGAGLAGGYLLQVTQNLLLSEGDCPERKG